MTVRILTGDCRERMQDLEPQSVQCVVTSPPYFGLRDYQVDGQIGLEESPDAYVANLVEAFRAVWRVLRDDGTVWLNLGDSYASAWACSRRNVVGNGSLEKGKRESRPNRLVNGLKEKDLIGIPWRVAFALQADGWTLRQDIVWNKPNPMPESVTDRCTKAHEYVFLLTKKPRYYYDAKAIAEAAKCPGDNRAERADVRKSVDPFCMDGGSRTRTGKPTGETVNARSVWTIASQPFREAHFAVFPPALAERCILAGSRPGDVILDPFGGAGTTGVVADRLGRDCVLIELNPEYAEMTERRIQKDGGMFAQVEVSR